MRLRLCIVALIAVACGPSPGPGPTTDGGSTDAGVPDAGAICGIQFIQPAITASTNPPVADVTGSSSLELRFTGAAAASVAVTMGNSTLVEWTDPTGTYLQETVNWHTSIGTGMHTLVAELRTLDGSVCSAILDVNVQ
jgi:hypothetical protein